MSARPGQWELLGADGDPVPGDPYEVAQEQRHYAEVANRIHDQVARLRRMADGSNELVGRYAEALKGSAAELADHLDTARGRFETVGSQLGRWQPALDAARTDTRAQLDDAVAAHQAMQANQPGPAAPPGAEPPTDAEVAAEKRRSARYSSASGDLQAVIGRFHRTMEHLDGVARDVARAIRHASDDHLKDSTWDRFKDFVHSISGVLSFVAEALAWIATVLVVLALFIPGINLLIIAALLAGALLIHSLLAATDNGSWMDVALDVVALATLGLGSAGVAVARLGRAATLLRAGRVAGKAAKAAVYAKAALGLGRGPLGQVARLASRVGAIPQASRAYRAARAVWTARELPEVTVAQSIKAGLSREAAELAVDRALLETELQHTVNLMFRGGVDVAQFGFRAGVAADVTFKALNGSYPDFAHHEVDYAYHVAPWERFKEKFVVSWGTAW